MERIRIEKHAERRTGGQHPIARSLRFRPHAPASGSHPQQRKDGLELSAEAHLVHVEVIKPVELDVLLEALRVRPAAYVLTLSRRAIRTIPGDCRLTAGARGALEDTARFEF